VCRRTWNLAPTDDAPVIRLAANGERHLDVLKWGLVPYFTKVLKSARKPINARSGTVATSGMFKAAFAKRRCLVPAYYEWRDDPDGKTPFAVARADGDPVVFAGIWEDWRSPDGDVLHTFSTITTDANRQLPAIQDRMPVILEKEDWPVWLGEAEGDVPACSARCPRMCCDFGQSISGSATSRTTGRSYSSELQTRPLPARANGFVSEHWETAAGASAFDVRASSRTLCIQAG
jgi:putative SOS response-associated peptidase YedK